MSSEENTGNKSKITAGILGTLGYLRLLALVSFLVFVPLLVVLIACGLHAQGVITPMKDILRWVISRPKPSYIAKRCARNVLC